MDNLSNWTDIYMDSINNTVRHCHFVSLNAYRVTLNVKSILPAVQLVIVKHIQ